MAGLETRTVAGSIVGVPLLVLAILLAILLIGLWLHSHSLQRGQLKTLEHRLQQLEARLGALPPAPVGQAVGKRLETEPSAPVPSAPPLGPSRLRPAAAESAVVADVVEGDVALVVVPPMDADVGTASPTGPAFPPPPPLPPRTPSPRGPRTPGKLERLLVENWTGILGVMVVVAGVTFVVVNVGLRLGGFERFLITVATAAALAAPSLLLGRPSPWRELSLWMRSGGGALLLFACAAAGSLPELGLRWIEAPGPAVLLLAVGMAVNLLLARVAPSQSVASLHVVVNLVPLLIASQNPITLALATLVTVAGLAMPLPQRQERHQLVVTWAYAGFQLWRLAGNGALLEAMQPERGFALVGALVVFGGGALWQHHPRGRAPELRPLPLLLLLSRWGGVGLALLVTPTHAAQRIVGLALAAALAYTLGKGAGRAGVRWLVRCDLLVAQVLAMAAVLSLQPLVVNGPLLVAGLWLETVLFLGLAVSEHDPVLRRWGWGAVNLVAVALVFTGLITAAVDALTTAPTALEQGQNAAVLIGAGLLAALLQLLLQRRAVPLPWPAALGWISGLLVAVGTSISAPAPWRETLALVVVGALLLLARRQRPPGLLGGCGLAIVMAHLTSWLVLVVQAPWSLAPLLIRLLPLAALSLLLAGAGGRPALRATGLHLFGVTAALGVYLALAPISELLPGTAWLALAAGALELARRRSRGPALQLLVMALGYLVLFLTAYLLVILPSPELLSLGRVSFSARLPIQLFALVVALRVWFLRPGAGLTALPLWRGVQPLALEAAVLVSVLGIAVEVGPLWRPVAWSLLAVLLVIPKLQRLFAPRLAVYAVLVYWRGILGLLAMLDTLPPAPERWLGQPQTVGVLAIALEVLFILLAHKKLETPLQAASQGLPLLSWIARRVAAAPNRWLYYPMFVAVAWSLAARYDRSLLTLLWALQAFVIYLLSAVLRDQQFRWLALLGLGACLVRLVAIDMAQADLGLRGVVFIGVGLLMLAMNAIYNRFRARFNSGR